MANILLIDDDTELTSLLKDLLELEGYSVNIADNGQQGLEKIAVDTDLVLLDVMMPVLNGMETLRRLRDQWETPVLMLTAKGEEIDRVMGLELGADDYLPKPFSDRELLARMRAILRRTGKGNDEKRTDDAQEKLEYQDIEIFPGKMEVYCQQQLIDLTGTETALLTYLVRRPGTIVAKADISLNVLGKRLAPFDRAIDMHISNIRKKLPERADGKPRIKTLRGRGYLLVEV
ncbi:DNA-binding response regulator [Enterovibrio norvegicus]|uniref:Response regulator n=1 Tax=Enterovibrio norvegicus TaxID=188144 RepID=A0ABV4L3K9_9GAMM|nr:response regulator [Enterovibrio norvegicus]MCC4800140.1 response regulator [Enterovibrio norvegicus]OEE45675.1 DNA-binding response regulator [Enterovibrio norvegicus]OEF53324.1 DNA-binding response regulator [Enterovibrio norvegicus]OEF63082.1 DNA-binding response regulator [Enterovibrio norvegicus]PMI35496.1 DNA-binding response regulator [Enterovibrio norvegicus]